MNRKRLRILQRRLESVVEKNYAQTRYYCKDECGTSACALGHACLIPSFQRDGLVLGRKSIPKLRRTSLVGEDAAAVFFGISRDTAYSIFGYGVCTAKRKAKQIGRLLSMGEDKFSEHREASDGYRRQRVLSV